MQKIMYINNNTLHSKDASVNDNFHMRELNKMLEEGWQITNITPNVCALNELKCFNGTETFAAFVVINKPDEK